MFTFLLLQRKQKHQKNMKNIRKLFNCLWNLIGVLSKVFFSFIKKKRKIINQSVKHAKLKAVEKPLVTLKK
jgi:hypothetical protein